MNTPEVHRPCRTKRWFAAIMLLCSCVLALVPVGYGQADRVSQLIEKLKHPDGRMRLQAVTELGMIGAPAVEPLIAALRDADSHVQGGAADALGEIKDPRAVAPLIAALKDGDWDVRESAAWALGKIKDPRAVEPLIATLKDAESGVRGWAARALGEIGAPAVEPLIAALKDADSGVRGWAAWALGDIKDQRAVEPLMAILKDPMWDVRRDGAEALGKIKDPRAVGPLIDALKGADAYLRRGAAEALGEIKDPRAVEPLIDALKDADADVRRNAVAALERIGTPAVEALIAALKDPDAHVRGNAAEVLGEIKDPRSANPLLAALRQLDLAVIVAAYRFFIERGEPGSEDALIQALNAHGSGKMARDYLNCGNWALEAAAREWARQHGFKVVSWPSSGQAREGVRWGSRR